ncbi:2-C-methyl-D-erythritol 2,4-cyclodiphosphate synthase [Candidatus Ichthyocystis hellenicum]|uniref:2-C-methyl-D-erythritol 2,4-cyclodiphosphate synthase n=1 Tax=Candidatus Ichthyocystis hellenicum TaxID=1561003 RepID=UPI000A78679A|nr:2-C-methyl-D-erythritol 2,4-cyclodiphosphate synthase [Candidatus Ichthyocystis hellenicum]
MFKQALKLWSIVVAAGIGSRFRQDLPEEERVQPKQYQLVGGHPMVAYSLYTISRIFGTRGVVLVLPKDGGDERGIEFWKEYTHSVPLFLCKGGDTRHESVRCGLRAIPSCVDNEDWVAVHDAARPALMFRDCQDLMVSLSNKGVIGAFLASPEVDSLKEFNDDGGFYRSVSNDRIYRAQTPQIFRYGTLVDSLAAAPGAGDEVSAVESLYGSDLICPVIIGPHNMKVTYRRDLEAVKLHLLAHPLYKQQLVRVGYGYDSHRLCEGLPLVVGGVRIPYSHGLIGHSDADVLLHALMDALLGGCGRMDMGHYFPQTDVGYKNADSQQLLEVLYRDVIFPYRVINIDATIIAEEPRLSPFVDDMKGNISRSLGIDQSCIGIKCKTAESMGALGRKEGLAAQVVVSLWCY